MFYIRLSLPLFSSSIRHKVWVSQRLLKNIQDLPLLRFDGIGLSLRWKKNNYSIISQYRMHKCT